MIRIAEVLVAALLTIGGTSLAAPVAAANGAAPAAAALHRLIDAAWQRELREDPIEASLDGFHQYDGLWPDVSLDALAREHQEDIQTLKNLAAIDPRLLSGEDRISYDLFEYRYRMQVQDYDLDGYLMPVNELDGIQTLQTLTHTLRFENASDYRNFLHRLQTFKPYMDETIALLRQGVREGMTEPRVVMKRVPHQIAAYVVADPTRSPLYEPFATMPDIIPRAEQAQLRSEARAAIARAVTPAYRDLEQYFEHDYLPHCRTGIAAEALPNGKAYYAFQVRKYTTTDLTPGQIHAMGLRKVAEIHAQMEQVFKEVGFKGSYRDFVRYLRTNPRFYYEHPRDLLEAYRAAAKRVDPLLVSEFPVRILPRVTYGVRPIPASLAPDTYPAYSVPPAGDGSVAGYMAVNLYKPESRPKYEIQVLTCHEGRPGHQLQIPIAMELRHLPDFRRFDYYSSYGEGWALYTETLCDQMGLYDDPYSKFGYLDFQMWRAVRLVVDTGMHSEGWTRAQAVRYFEDNSALSEQNIDTEVDRYIAWPGQALSYMIGELDIQRLRTKAEDALGSRFSRNSTRRCSSTAPCRSRFSIRSSAAGSTLSGRAGPRHPRRTDTAGKAGVSHVIARSTDAREGRPGGGRTRSADLPQAGHRRCRAGRHRRHNCARWVHGGRYCARCALEGEDLRARPFQVRASRMGLATFRARLPSGAATGQGRWPAHRHGCAVCSGLPA
jgi:uncharacterized protein (DUF885 family)